MSENKILDTAKTLGFGTELEYTNISREGAARAIQSVVGGRISHTGGSYDAWTVTAPDGRKWKAVSDGSLGSRTTSAEVVTPILHWEDFDTLQEVVRALRRAGAKTPACTSQHVHVGVEDFTAAQIANFARIWYKQEKLLLKAIGTLPSRLAHYTKPTDREFIDRLEKMKPQTREQLNIAWYGYANPRPAHYDGTRYRAINLNNVWTTGTVELRAYNGTNHAGHAKHCCVLALLIAAKAKTAKCASTKKPRVYNEESAAYDMRVFLLHLQAIGPEFKNFRKYLLDNLPGNKAWKHGRPNA
jgi:hypothetical protein